MLTTDNKYFIKGSHKEQNIITYEKGIATKEKISKQNFIEKDLMGFGTAVGSFSNTATILYAMIGDFYREDQKEQRDELYNRIKLLRQYVGQEIDRAKLGIKQPKLPKDWKKRKKILDIDTPDELKYKLKQNSMVISKKPYFFRYLYPELNERYKKYEKLHDVVSKDKFGIKFKKLLEQPNKTKDELDLIKRYKKYSPLIMSSCPMNILCKEFENIDFDIKYNKKAVSMLPKFEDKFTFDIYKKDIIKKLYRLYNGNKSLTMIELIFSGIKNESEIREIKMNELDYMKDYIKEELLKNEINDEEFLYYCWKISVEYSNYNWNFCWDVLGEDILDMIKEGDTVIPIRDKNGEEYLGSNYSLKFITIEEKNEFKK